LAARERLRLLFGKRRRRRGSGMPKCRCRRQRAAPFACLSRGALLREGLLALDLFLLPPPPLPSLEGRASSWKEGGQASRTTARNAYRWEKTCVRVTGGVGRKGLPFTLPHALYIGASTSPV